MTSMCLPVAFWKLKGGEELLTLSNFICFSIKQIQFVAPQSLTDNERELRHALGIKESWGELHMRDTAYNNRAHLFY